jgi:hypothetical protein
MRNDPLFTVWTVHFATPEEATRARGVLHALEDLNSVVVDSVISSGAIRDVPYRVGDFFEEVRLFPGPPEDRFSVRVLFRRLPTAGRFWKDIMVNLLDSIRRTHGDVTITLAYKGNDFPEHVSTT